MTTLTALATATVVAGIIAGALAGLLALITWHRRTREATIEWQVRLTDAIHADLGAVVAPTVRRRLLGPWTVSMAAPLARPELLARVLAVLARALAAQQRRPIQIVLTPRSDGR